MSGSSNVELDHILETLLDLQRRGQVVEVNRLIERYPAYSEDLRGFLEDSAFLEPFFCEARASVASDDGDDGAQARVVESEPNEDSASELPRLRGFRVLEELGSGSQGVVYKALQLGTERIVALKVIRDGLFASFRERLRFENEIRVAAQLQHPNVVAIYGSGTERGRHYFFMEYTDGEPLDLYLSTRTLSTQETLQLFATICDAVGCAHQQGIIHRDLKPANVLIDRQGRPHVLDFGLAKRIDASDEPAITQVGSFAGTWYYASPEQVRRDNCAPDVRSDVYALGVMLYEAVMDALPYPVCGASSDRIAHQILHVEPVRPTLIRRDVGDELETIILQALQKAPERRYQSASALQEDLLRFLAGEPIEAKRDRPLYVLRKSLYYYRRWVIAATTAFIFLFAFATAVTIMYSEARTARATSEARANFGRLGLGFLLHQLDVQCELRNALALVAEQEPNHPAVRRLARPVTPVPVDAIDSLVRSWRPEFNVVLRRGGELDTEGLHRWAMTNTELIEQLRTEVLSKRLVFGTETAGSYWLIAQHPSNSFSAQQLCSAFAIAALDGAVSQRADLAELNLDAARSVALDLADGATILHRDAALACRQDMYAVVLTILETSWGEEKEVSRWTDWLGSDPPLPTLRDTVIAEQMKAFQIIEGAIRETDPGGHGHIDLKTLDALVDGLYTELKVLTSSDIDALRGVLPTDLLAALDRFGRAVEAQSVADDPIDHTRVSLPLHDDSAFRLLNPLLPSFTGGFRYREQVAAWRRAAELACGSCTFRIANGVWPGSLQELCEDGMKEYSAPPTGAFRIAYEFVGSAPQLVLQSVDSRPAGRSTPPTRPPTEFILFRPRLPE